MSVFCDTSAIVKLYADEHQSDQVRALDSMVVSLVARVEVVAAIWRKHRIQELTSNEAHLLVGAFEWDWFGGSGDTNPKFAIVEMTDQILDTAAQLLALHPLRAYDAIQLAAAVTARREDPDLTDFACFDNQLTLAAQAEGFRVWSNLS